MYIPQEQCGPIIPPSIGFPFRRRITVEVFEPSYTRGLIRNVSWFSVNKLGSDRRENSASNSSSVVVNMSVSAIR
jgi:hypothetical protein